MKCSGLLNLNQINTNFQSGSIFAQPTENISREEYLDALSKLWKSPYRTVIISYAWNYSRNHGEVIFEGQFTKEVEEVLQKILKKYPCPERMEGITVQSNGRPNRRAKKNVSRKKS